MAESVPVVQTSEEDSVWVTSSDHTENIHEEERKTFPTFGFDVKTRKTDLTLTFGNHRLYVRRVLLEEASPVLERLFEEKLDEKTDQELAIEDVSCEDFAEFLACTLCIQRRGRRKITRENIYRMLEVANTYEVEDVKERCEECLLDMVDEEKQNPMSVLRLLHLANENNLPSLKSKCMERADWKILDALQENDTYFNISSSSKSELDGRFMPVVLSNSYVIDFLKTSSKSGDKLSAILGFQNAKGFKTRCNVSSETYKQSFKLWDITWNLEVGGRGTYNDLFYPWLIKLQVNKDINPQESAEVGIACKILNYMPNKKDSSAFRTFTFTFTVQEIKNGISWYSNHDMDIKESELKDENRGFSYGGKYDIEVYVLMNKPESVNS